MNIPKRNRKKERNISNIFDDKNVTTNWERKRKGDGESQKAPSKEKRDEQAKFPFFCGKDGRAEVQEWGKKSREWDFFIPHVSREVLTSKINMSKKKKKKLFSSHSSCLLLNPPKLAGAFSEKDCHSSGGGGEFLPKFHFLSFLLLLFNCTSFLAWQSWGKMRNGRGREFSWVWTVYPSLYPVSPPFQFPFCPLRTEFNFK